MSGKARLFFSEPNEVETDSWEAPTAVVLDNRYGCKGHLTFRDDCVSHHID